MGIQDYSKTVQGPSQEPRTLVGTVSHTIKRSVWDGFTRLVGQVKYASTLIGLYGKQGVRIYVQS